MIIINTMIDSLGYLTIHNHERGKFSASVRVNVAQAADLVKDRPFASKLDVWEFEAHSVNPGLRKFLIFESEIHRNSTSLRSCSLVDLCHRRLLVSVSWA